MTKSTTENSIHRRIPRRKAQLFCPEETRTEQHHKESLDVNNIVRFHTQGSRQPIDLGIHSGQYGFADAATFQDAMYITAKAQQMFDALPSKLRNEFQNDPAQFLEFTQNPDNKDRMIELGLATEPPLDVPMETFKILKEIRDSSSTPDDPPTAD